MSGAQPDLFGTPPGWPDGLVYRPGLFSAAEQAAMIEQLASLPFQPFDFHGYKGNRRIVSFGVRYDYSREAVAAADPLPDFLVPVRAAAAAFAGLDPAMLGHALVNEYAPGAGIGWHRDKAVFGEVVGLSFAAPCILRFRRARQGGGWERHGLHLEPGSAYLLKGPARSVWEHSIAPLDRLRYSVTFRRYAAGGSGSSEGSGG